MPTPPLTDEDCRQAVELAGQFPTLNEAAQSIGKDWHWIKRRLNTAARRGLMGKEPVLEGFRISKTTAVYDEAGNIVRNFVQQKPDTGDKFEMPDGHGLKGVSAYLDAQGNVIGQWVKTGRENGALDVVEAVKEALAGQEGTSALYPPPEEAEPKTFTVIPLVDWHVGLLAWSRECGENYDLSIARKVILDAMAKVIALSPPSEECIILGFGDALHSDGYEPITSKSGNFLDVDGRYPKVLKTAVEMIRATVDMAAQKFSRVHVRILPGNHDDRSTVALSVGFSLLYENNERVTFDDSPSRFWWHRKGKVLLGAVHGDRTKMKDLPLVMAHDRPDDWAASTYRRIYTGHVHHESAIEDGGVLVTSMRSPVAKDAYHSFSKYRSGRSVYSDTYNIDGGMAASVKVNL